jgi:hypothetical protein
MDTTDDLQLYKDGYLSHPPPVYEEHHDEVPAHFEIPSENGFFPAAASSQAAVASCCPATLYQMHPTYKEKQLDHPIATGTLVLSDPDDGTASQVALVGECDGITFYLLEDDATTKTSETEFMLLLPKDCILVDVSGAPPESILHLEAVLHARTKFHDETSATTTSEDESDVYPELLPQDKISRGIYQTSKCMSRMIVSASGKVANGIHAYGERRKDAVTETKEKRVSQTSIKMAKATRRVSDTTLRVSIKVSDKISNVIGGSVGKAVAPKPTDSAGKKKARELLLASTIAMDEVSDGVSEGYELMVQAAKAQATGFVAKKYGEDAAELARHTAGSAANFGRTALTARRIVNVKKIAKSAGKNAVKSAIKNSLTK